MSWRVLTGDCREVLRSLDASSVHTCVTSPPYFGLRDYGHPGQLGLEPTPAEFVAALVKTFREVRRVLRDDGTVFLNLGDSFGEAKQLQGIPWRVALALQADDWTLRSDIIWSKPNPMPEPVTDRPTKAHEYVFLLSKSPHYHYDADAIREPHETELPVVSKGRSRRREADDGALEERDRDGWGSLGYGVGGRNKRSVWTVATQPYSGAHFATFPPALIEPCILAGCPEGGTVLDPFNGAGTTGMVALRRNRSYVGIELNPEYADLARNRIRDDAPLLNTHAEAA